MTNTVELVQYLMKNYNLPASGGVRHYDASRKSCPGSMKANNWAKWNDFKSKLEESSANKPPVVPPTNSKKVTVAKHASNWSKSSKGAKIASWVKGKSFEYRQDRAISPSHSNCEYLVYNDGKPIGWILSQDVEGGYGSEKVGKPNLTPTPNKRVKEYNVRY